MFIEERHQQILKTLNDTGRITTAQIEAAFGVSYDSAKRDLRIPRRKVCSSAPTVAPCPFDL